MDIRIGPITRDVIIGVFSCEDCGEKLGPWEFKYCGECETIAGKMDALKDMMKDYEDTFVPILNDDEIDNYLLLKKQYYFFMKKLNAKRTIVNYRKYNDLCWKCGKNKLANIMSAFWNIDTIGMCNKCVFDVK